MSYGPMIGIQPDYTSPPASNSAPIGPILDYMAALELWGLAFLGLQAAYGTNQPDVLPATYPLALHYLDESGAELSSFTSGNTIAHTGGYRQHLYHVAIALIVDRRAGHDLVELNARTTAWVLAYDWLYSVNGKLGGRVQAVGLRRARFGVIEYAEDEYYGWTLRGDVLTKYLM